MRAVVVIIVLAIIAVGGYLAYLEFYGGGIGTLTGEPAPVTPATDAYADPAAVVVDPNAEVEAVPTATPVLTTTPVATTTPVPTTTSVPTTTPVLTTTPIPTVTPVPTVSPEVEGIIVPEVETDPAVEPVITPTP